MKEVQTKLSSAGKGGEINGRSPNNPQRRQKPEVISLKSYTSRRRANRLLGRHGSFWQRESFDHLLRNRKKWRTTLVFILENPVKAGLEKDTGGIYPWTWVRKRFDDVLEALYGGAR